MTSGILFSIVWLVIALYLFYVALTEDTFFFFIAPFFVFLAAWAFINEKTSADLMAGPFLWIYRGVAAVMLIICAVKYILDKKRR